MGGAGASKASIAGAPSELAHPDTGATVTPATLESADAAAAASRPNLLYVCCGVVGGASALASAAGAGPPLARLAAAALPPLVALVRAHAVPAVYLDCAAPSSAAGLLRAAGAAHVAYWPSPEGGPVPRLASPPPSAAAASVAGHAFFAALAAPGATFPEAFALCLCALQAHTSAGAPVPKAVRAAAAAAAAAAPPPPSTTTTCPDGKRLTVKLPAAPRPLEGPDLPRPRVGLPALDSAHAPSLPSLDAVPSSEAAGPDAAWADTRLFSPPGEAVLTVAGRRRPGPRRLAFLGEAVRAALVMQARLAVVTSASRADAPAILSEAGAEPAMDDDPDAAGAPLLPPDATVAACTVRTPAGSSAPVLLAGPLPLLTSPARLEAAVRAGTAAAAMTLQLHAPAAGAAPAPRPRLGGPGVPPALDAPEESSAPRPPAVAVEAAGPLWAVATLTAMAGRAGDAASPPAPGAGPAARLLAALGVAGVGPVPVACFDAAAAARFAAAAAEEPIFPVQLTAADEATAPAVSVGSPSLARRDPRAAGGAGASRPTSAAAASPHGPMLPPRPSRASARHATPDPARPPLDECPPATFVADAKRFAPAPPPAAPAPAAAGKPPGSAKAAPWPDALLHGRPIDAHALYCAVTAAGGSAALRAAKGAGAAWADAVLPALAPTNAPAAGPPRSLSALGDDLARLYESCGLAAYERAYAGDVRKRADGEDGTSAKRARV